MAKDTIAWAIVAATAFVAPHRNAQPDAATEAKAQVCEACAMAQTAIRPIRSTRF